MEGMRVGLRHRLQRTLRRVEEQHRHLRDVGAELDRALASSIGSDIHGWIERLGDALSAHFDLEEDVLFPAVHGLAPDTLGELTQLERDHGDFLEALRDLRGDWGEPSTALLRSLQERLAAHELHEERLVKQALADARPQRRRSGS